MHFNKYCYVILVAFFAVNCNENNADQASVGQGGSMTRFAIQHEYLYLADNQRITVYNIHDGVFEQINEVSVGFGLETIFARGQYLYLGAFDAMYIYSIADPASPSFIFRYAHIESCDPVVVQGNRAYVTLRAGSACNRGVNALEIIDITNPHQPDLIANYPMISPHGLGVKGDYLFLCEGESGLKVFDISNETSIKLLKHLQEFFAYDVIVESNQITVTGEDGIFQFAYPHEEEVLELLSTIPVNREEL